MIFHIKEMMMKRMILCLSILASIWQACSDEESLPVVKPDYQGIYVDAAGNKYPYVRYGNLEWMTENLAIETLTGSIVTHEEERNPIDKNLEIAKNRQTFGRLYTYSTAIASAPRGWRLPTDEDWQNLEKALGMSAGEAAGDNWRGAPVGELMQQQEGTCLNMRNGGMGEDDYYKGFIPYFPYVYGFYWTSTPSEDGTMVYCRQISYKSGQVARTLVDKEKMLSVRYVRDVQQ